MLPAISHATSPPRAIPFADPQLDPLTLRHVLRESYLEPGSTHNIRRMGELSWVENQRIASLETRITFINKMVNHVLEHLPMKDTALTFISLGAGGLLTERLIDYQLKKAGYQTIRWRLIDIDYQQQGYEEARRAFREKADNQALYFTTEQAYLNKSIGATALAEDDRQRGATLLLTLDPPTPLEHSVMDSPSYKACLLVRGRPIDDISKANGIYLLVAKQCHRERLERVQQALSQGNQMITSDCILKFTLGDFNQCAIQVSPSSTGQRFHRDVLPFIEMMHKVATLIGQKLNLRHVNKALDKYLASLDGLDYCGVKFYVSDYDTSRGKLEAYYRGGANPFLTGSLDRNEITLG